MPGQIYKSAQEGKLEVLEEESFASEKDFQILIGKHPELLAGEQITPEEPRRWMLITSEKGIVQSVGQADWWALDLLLVDQDGILTLAELKRGANPEIRRKVVGQVLEYAVHASATWTVDELRNAFEDRVKKQGLDPNHEVADLLSGEKPNTEDFWSKVSSESFTRDVSSKDLNAWTVSHDDAAKHADLLVKRLGEVLNTLASLPTNSVA